MKCKKENIFILNFWPAVMAGLIHLPLLFLFSYLQSYAVLAEHQSSTRVVNIMRVPVRQIRPVSSSSQVKKEPEKIVKKIPEPVKKQPVEQKKTKKEKKTFKTAVRKKKKTIKKLIVKKKCLKKNNRKSVNPAKPWKSSPPEWVKKIRDVLHSNKKSLHPQKRKTAGTSVKKIVPNKHVSDSSITLYNEYISHLMAKIRKHIFYPGNARYNCQEGRVMIVFSLTSDGSLTNCKVKESSFPVLKSAALQILKSAAPFRKPPDNFNSYYPVIAVPIDFSLKKKRINHENKMEY